MMKGWSCGKRLEEVSLFPYLDRSILQFLLLSFPFLLFMVSCCFLFPPYIFQQSDQMMIGWSCGKRFGAEKIIQKISALVDSNASWWTIQIDQCRNLRLKQQWMLRGHLLFLQNIMEEIVCVLSRAIQSHTDSFHALCPFRSNLHLFTHTPRFKQPHLKSGFWTLPQRK